MNFTIRVTDQDRAGAEVFVNGQKVWSMDRTPETAEAISTTFFTETVPIPAELYRDADSITVKFAAKRGVMTGDLVDVRLVRDEE